MVMIDIYPENFDRLEKERINFQEVIGGGKWTINHTLVEIFKILDMLDAKAKIKGDNYGKKDC